MTARDILIEQLKATTDEDGWFIATRNAIRGVTAEQAVWTSHGVDHSILGTLSHMNFYNERHLRRLHGEDVGDGPEQIADTYVSPDEPNEAAWRKEKARFTRVMAGWVELVANGGPLKNARAGSSGRSSAARAKAASWMPVVSHLALHNAYHCGQIVMIRKLQGSWNRAKGMV